jgi:hypothetical protein
LRRPQLLLPSDVETRQGKTGAASPPATASLTEPVGADLDPGDGQVLTLIGVRTTSVAAYSFMKS